MNIIRYTIILLAVATLPLSSIAQVNDADGAFRFAPLNWAFQIPDYYYIDSTHVQPHPTIIDSTITPILLINKGTRNQMYTRLVPIELYRPIGGYKGFWDKFIAVQYKQATDFDDKPDTLQSPVTIHGRNFTRFEMTTKTKGKVTDYFCVYATVIDGKDFVTEILANNADDRDLLTNAWKKSLINLKK